MLVHRARRDDLFPSTFLLLGRIVRGLGSQAPSSPPAPSRCTAAAERARQSHRRAVRAAIQLGVPIGARLWRLPLGAGLNDALTFGAGALGLFLSGICAYVLIPDLRVHVARRASIARSRCARWRTLMATIGILGFASAFCSSGMVLTTTTLLVHTYRLSVFGLPERFTPQACSWVARRLGGARHDAVRAPQIVATGTQIAVAGWR